VSDLPQTWTNCRLGDVVDYGSTRKCEPVDIPGDSWVLELEDIEKGTSRLLDRQTFAQRQSKSTKNCFDAGDVLYGKLRPYLNKVLIADQPGYCTTEIVPLKAGTHLDARYLFYWLKHPTFLAYVEAESHGLNMPRLGTDTGRAAPFVFAPRSEQARIADKLDAVLMRVDTCRNRLVRVPAILKRFRQSVLAAATSGRLTEDWRDQFPDRIDATNIAEKIHASHEAAGGHKMGNAAAPTEDVHDLSIDMFPSGWGLVTLRDIVLPDRPITYGILKPGPELDDGVPYIRVADFPGDKLNPATVRKTSREINEEFKRSRLRSGDLLLSIRGTVGRIVIIPDELEGANITQDSARLSVQPVVNRDYVLWYLRSEMAQQRMKGSTKGVAVRGINIGDVRALQLPLPSREEQNEIVRRIEKLFAFADRLEARNTAAHAQVDKLTPSLLAKAFRGEMVPQDTNDEPASVLLDRIHAARSKASTEPKLRARRAGLSNIEAPMLTTDKNAPDYLTAILRRSSGHTLDAKALWRESQLSIPDFYEKLKAEADRGLLQEIKKEARSFLEAV